MVRLCLIFAIASPADGVDPGSLTAELPSGEARGHLVYRCACSRAWRFAAGVGLAGTSDGVRTALAGFERRYLDPDWSGHPRRWRDDKVRRCGRRAWVTHYRPAALAGCNRLLQAGSAG